ncbi:hypothetical protein ACFRDV_22105 [Streptomyces fagopyri]|uniref:hypothetical protein n=1 Tax=Streptomyces fagopyri TaxID=2662397 RepID=UPI0036A9E2EE
MTPESQSAPPGERFSAVGRIVADTAFGAYGALDLMMRRLAGEVLAKARAAAELDQYLRLADHLGVDRADAERILRTVQPPWCAGEAPTSDEFAQAEAMLRCVASFMILEPTADEEDRARRQGLSERITETLARQRPLVRPCGCHRGE